MLRLIISIFVLYQVNHSVFHHKKNDTDININDKLMNLINKNFVAIPRELMPFEFELFFN